MRHLKRIPISLFLNIFWGDFGALWGNWGRIGHPSVQYSHVLFLRFFVIKFSETDDFLYIFKIFVANMQPRSNGSIL